MSSALSQRLSQRPDYRWWVLVTVALGTFASVIDIGMTSTALPTIETHFHTNLSTVQWVVLGNTLTISILLLPMGRLGDILGRPRLILIGYVIFAVTGLLGGLAPNLPLLIVAKVLQGIGSAMIQANFLALAVSVFPPKERGKVLGINLSVVGAGAVVGPAFGGLLVSALDWRAILFVNVFSGAIAFAAGYLIMDSTRLSDRALGAKRPSFDLIGAALSGLALLVFLLVMTNGYRQGWTSPLILAGAAGFILFFAAFVWWELRCPAPMLELRLFKRKVVAMGALGAWLSFFGTGAVLMIMPFYLQKVLGYSPGKAGLILIPGSLCMAVASGIAGPLSDRFGWRWFTVGGMALSAAAMFTLSFTLSAASPLVLIIPLLMVRFIGHGAFNSPNISSMMSGVDRTQYGVVTALTQLLRNSANVTGIALGTMIIVITMGARGYEPSLDAVAADGTLGVREAFVDGARYAFIGISALFVVGLLIALFKGERVPEPADAPGAGAPSDVPSPAQASPAP